MALLPVSTARTSTPLNNQRLLFQLNADQLAIQRQYDQLSTGRRVLRVSDDPAAAARAVNLQWGISATDQLARNATATQAYHQSTDSALDRIGTALIQARATAVEAGQNVISDAERQALADVVGETLRSVVTASNSMFADHQLIGGILQPSSPLQYENDTVKFNGTFAVGQTKTGETTPTLLNVSGEDAIGLSQPIVTGNPLSAGLNANTRLVDMRQGAGVRPGLIRISDGDRSVELDLSSAATIGNVTDAIRDVRLNGRAISVVLGPDSIRLQWADGLPGTLAIADAAGSALAADLQIANPGGFRSPPLIGDRLSPRVTSGTRVADLNGGLGLNLSAGIVIDSGDNRTTINLQNARTLGDVVIAINRSSAGVRAELDQNAGRIIVRGLVSGTDYSIGENGGNAATALGIRSGGPDTKVSELSRGRGLVLNPSGPDLVITRPDGVELPIELSSAGTVQDVMNLVNNHPLNQDTRRVIVSLNSVGNGLQLSGPPGVQPIRVTQPGASDAGTQLGWIPAGESVGEGTIVNGFAQLQGRDYRPLDSGGAIDSLLRLEKAIRSGDIAEIGRLQARLDVDFQKSTQTRGRVGAWSATVADLKTAAQDQNVLLQAQLSEAVDADLASVISTLNARQASLEASLRFVGQTAGLTVLNYL